MGLGRDWEACKGRVGVCRVEDDDEESAVAGAIVLRCGIADSRDGEVGGGTLPMLLWWLVASSSSSCSDGHWDTGDHCKEEEGGVVGGGGGGGDRMASRPPPLPKTGLDDDDMGVNKSVTCLPLVPPFVDDDDGPKVRKLGKLEEVEAEDETGTGSASCPRTPSGSSSPS